MFSTPSVRVTNHENTDSIMRKPQPTSTRKAFQDRSVNSKGNDFKTNTPFNKPQAKLLCELKAKAPLPEITKDDTPSWIMETSTLPTEHESNIWPFDKISKDEVKNMFMGNLPTPPPSPFNLEMDLDVLELPKPKQLVFKFEEEIGDDCNDGDFWPDLDSIVEKPHANFDF